MKTKPVNTERLSEQITILREILTGKQAAFADAYLDPRNKRNGTECARLAGYRGTMQSLGVTAHQLLKNHKVKEYLNAVLAETGRKTEVDMSLLRAELWSVYHEARAANDRSAANTALKMIGQTIAAFSDRVVSKDEDADSKLLSDSEREEAQKLVRLRMIQVERGTG
ncbi:terminase small subunit [Planctomycetota bacterium]